MRPQTQGVNVRQILQIQGTDRVTETQQPSPKKLIKDDYISFDKASKVSKKTSDFITKIKL